MTEEQQATFERIFEEYKNPLYGYIHTMVRSSADVEDVFQDVWMQVHKSLASYEERGALKGWLYRIAANKVRDFYRRQRPEVNWEEDVPVEAAPLLGLIDRERSDFLEEAVAGLSPKLREVYLLRTEGELKFREIAELLDAPLSRVLQRMHMAVKVLRKAYERYESM